MSSCGESTVMSSLIGFSKKRPCPEDEAMSMACCTGSDHLAPNSNFSDMDDMVQHTLDPDSLHQQLISAKQSCTIPSQADQAYAAALTVQVGSRSFRMWSADLLAYTGERFLQDLNSTSSPSSACHTITLDPSEVPEPETVLEILSMRAPSTLNLRQLAGVIQTCAYLNAFSVLESLTTYITHTAALSAHQVIDLLAVAIHYTVDGPLVHHFISLLAACDAGKAITRTPIIMYLCKSLSSCVSQELCRTLRHRDYLSRHLTIRSEVLWNLMWLAVQAYACDGSSCESEDSSLPTPHHAAALEKVPSDLLVDFTSTCSSQWCACRRIFASGFQTPSDKLLKVPPLRAVAMQHGSCGRFAVRIPSVAAANQHLSTSCVLLEIEGRMYCFSISARPTATQKRPADGSIAPLPCLSLYLNSTDKHTHFMFTMGLARFDSQHPDILSTLRCGMNNGPCRKEERIQLGKGWGWFMFASREEVDALAPEPTDHILAWAEVHIAPRAP